MCFILDIIMTNIIMFQFAFRIANTDTCHSIFLKQITIYLRSTVKNHMLSIFNIT